MAWIETIDETDADEPLKKIYNKLKKKRGKVANILKIHSLLPKTMHDHMQLYNDIMFNKSKISRENKELIAVVVSKLNNCSYCITHHVEALNFYWKNKAKIQALLKNMNYSTLSSKKQAMLSYAEKLTKNPEKIKESDITKLRTENLTDKEILEIALIVSYFNFVNRIALGLNVTFNEKEIKGYKY